MPNPYDPDKVVNDPLHRQIQVLSVPLSNPAATTEIAAPGSSTRVIGRQDRLVRAQSLRHAGGAARAGGGGVPRHRGPHGHNLAGAACAEQGQIWEIDPDTRIPDDPPDDGRRRRGDVGWQWPVPQARSTSSTR